MFQQLKRCRVSSMKSIAVALALSICAVAAVPKGWILAGSKPTAYETGMDSDAVYNDHPSAYLKSIRADICDNQASGSDRNDCGGFGTLMQSFGADQYQGKRVRLSGFVKSEAVDDWAGLWMRVDKGGTMAVAFDNMQDRPIKGTSGWHNYQIVLDVPADATNVAFGILLAGHGQVWLNGVKLEVVGSDVPITGPQGTTAAAPTNLGFER